MAGNPSVLLALATAHPCSTFQKNFGGAQSTDLAFSSPPEFQSQNHLPSGGFTEKGSQTRGRKSCPGLERRKRGKKGMRERKRKKWGEGGSRGGEEEIEEERDEWVHAHVPRVLSGSAHHTEVAGNSSGVLTL